MSSDPPIEDPSPQAEPSVSDTALAALIRERGEPLLEGLETQLPGSAERAEAIGAYALATAVGLGFERAEADLWRQTARLANSGKIYSPEGSHQEAGARLARGAGIPGVVCDWLLRAQERYDGSGPGGLSGAEIPVFSRIIRTSVRCDELITAGALPTAMKELSGTELDPNMVDALASMLERAAT